MIVMLYADQFLLLGLTDHCKRYLPERRLEQTHERR